MTNKRESEPVSDDLAAILDGEFGPGGEARAQQLARARDAAERNGFDFNKCYLFNGCLYCWHNGKWQKLCDPV